MEQGLYPLKFLPLFKQRVWGGNKISEVLGVDYSPLGSCAELWCLSGLPDNETVVANGYLAETNLSEVIEMYTDELLGEENYAEFGTEFPLLLKVLDANQNLSVQVHPDDDFARASGMPNGKTEMWYLLQADEDAMIYDGFKKNMTKAEVINRVRENTITEVLNGEKAEKGDLFFIPAGMVHSAGKGCLIAEVQQSSDATYRLYDWGRTDASGKPRTLHLEQGLKVMDLKAHPHSGKVHYHSHTNETTNLLTTPFFTTNRLYATQPIRKDYTGLDSFVILFCVAGQGFVHSENSRIPLHAGEVVMLPAVCNSAEIEPQGAMEVLEIFII